MSGVYNRKFHRNGWHRSIIEFRREYVAIVMVCCVLTILSRCSESETSRTQGLTGKGGSLARFAATDTHLYAVNYTALQVYRFEENGATTFVNSIELGTGVETITARGDELFIGTNQAMILYDITDGDNPQYLSQYTHFSGCDPVAVQDTLAFVTLRTTGCRPSSANTLDIVNVKNPLAPTVIVSYRLQSPYGLGIDGDLLFVCEGENGLNIYDVTNLYYLQVVKHFNVEAYDVIPNRGLLLLSGKQGIVQYDYSDKHNIRELSTISIP